MLTKDDITAHFAEHRDGITTLEELQGLLTNLASAAPAEGRETVSERAAMTQAWGEISAQMYARMVPWEFYQAGWTAARATAPTMGEAAQRVIDAARHMLGRGDTVVSPCFGNRAFISSSADVEALSNALAEFDFAAAKGGSDAD